MTEKVIKRDNENFQLRHLFKMTMANIKSNCKCRHTFYGDGIYKCLPDYSHWE